MIALMSVNMLKKQLDTTNMKDTQINELITSLSLVYQANTLSERLDALLNLYEKSNKYSKESNHISLVGSNNIIAQLNSEAMEFIKVITNSANEKDVEKAKWFREHYKVKNPDFIPNLSILSEKAKGKFLDKLFVSLSSVYDNLNIKRQKTNGTIKTVISEYITTDAYRDIPYYNEIEREEFRVFASQSKLWTMKRLGNDQDCKFELSEFNTDSFGYLYVISPTGDMFATEDMPFSIHHSSFLSGGPILCGGHLVVNNGIIQSIDNDSGHYKPGESSIFHAAKFLKKNNLITSALVVKQYNPEHKAFDVLNIQHMKNHHEDVKQTTKKR